MIKVTIDEPKAEENISVDKFLWIKNNNSAKPCCSAEFFINMHF
jgi:hypothetical protein